MCRTENGIALMTHKSIRDLLCSFKDKENTPWGRQEIARAITGMCRTENELAIMTDDESVKDLL